MNSIRVRVKQTLGERFRPRVLQVIVRVTFNRIDSVVHSAVFFHSLCCSFLVLPCYRVICSNREESSVRGSSLDCVCLSRFSCNLLENDCISASHFSFPRREKTRKPNKKKIEFEGLPFSSHRLVKTEKQKKKD